MIEVYDQQDLDEVLDRRRKMARQGGAFDPRQVPEIAAGYFWDPTSATGTGATLVVPEGNGKSTYNMVTPAANTAPTPGTINGQVVAQYANGTPDQIMRTNTTVQRGWTGATYFACWLQATTAPGNILGHYRTAQNLLLEVGADARVAADTGAGLQEQRFGAALPFGAAPFFMEGVFDPSQAAAARLRLFVDLVEQVPTLTVAAGSSLVDTAEFLTCGGVGGDSSTFNYTADFKTGVIYLGNGIPSAANRALLYAFRALK